MIITNWLGGDGDWATAADWSDGVPDAATTQATIGGAGRFGVTIASGETFAVGGLEVTDARATLAVAGRLNVYGTVNLGMATLDLSVGGDQGEINLVSTESGGRITSGELELMGAHTLGYGTIHFASAYASGGTDVLFDSGALTIGPNAQLVDDAAGVEATISGAGCVNDGTIVVGGSQADLGSFFTVADTTFTNNGVILAAASADHFSRFTAQGRSFTNAAGGRMIVGPDAEIRLGADASRYQRVGYFDNLGTISVAAGGTLSLYGVFDAADIGQVANHGVLVLEGALNNAGGTLALGTGDLSGTVQFGGTIVGGVVVADPHPARQELLGTLDGVTWRGALDLTPSGVFALSIENGLTLTGADGTGPGLMRADGGPSGPSTVKFFGVQTLDGGDVEVGAHTGLTFDVYGQAGAKSAELVFGDGVTIVADAAGAVLDFHGFGGHGGAGAIADVVNNGVILAGAAGGEVYIDTNDFDNRGQVTVSHGDVLAVSAFSSFYNSGSISVGAGSTMAFGGGYTGNFRNTGVISISRGGTMVVGGDFTTSILSGVQNSGAFAIAGDLENTGQTLTIGSGPLFDGQRTELVGSGAIDGGTLVLGGGAFGWDGGFLSDLQVQGTMNMSAAGAVTALAGGVTLTGAGGVGPGAVDLTGAGASLYFFFFYGVTDQSLDDATITVGHAGASDRVEMTPGREQPETLTLGAGVTIRASVANSTVAIGAGADPGADTLVLQGSIDAGAAGGSLTISIPTFVNDGLLAVYRGDTVSVTGAVSGTGAITLAGGGLTLAGVGAGQTLTFESGAANLALSDAAAFGGVIGGLRTGDKIDLIGVAATRLTLSGQDQLSVIDKGGTVASLQLEGAYTIAEFNLVADGAGGSLITIDTSAMRQAMAAFAAPAALAPPTQRPAEGVGPPRLIHA